MQLIIFQILAVSEQLHPGISQTPVTGFSTAALSTRSAPDTTLWQQPPNSIFTSTTEKYHQNTSMSIAHHNSWSARRISRTPSPSSARVSALLSERRLNERDRHPSLTELLFVYATHWLLVMYEGTNRELRWITSNVGVFLSQPRTRRSRGSDLLDELYDGWMVRPSCRPDVVGETTECWGDVSNSGGATEDVDFIVYSC